MNTPLDTNKIENWSRLSCRQQSFCIAIATGSNAKEAAIIAGYSARSAEARGSILRKQLLVRGVIEQLRKQIFSARALSIEESRALLADTIRSADLSLALNDDGYLDRANLKKHGAGLKKFVEKKHEGKGDSSSEVGLESVDRAAAVLADAKLAGWLDKKEETHDLGGVKVTVNIGKPNA